MFKSVLVQEADTQVQYYIGYYLLTLLQNLYGSKAVITHIVKNCLCMGILKLNTQNNISCLFGKGGEGKFGLTTGYIDYYCSSSINCQ